MPRRSRARRHIRRESGAVATDEARPEKDADRVSLAPLGFEEAVAGLLRTKPAKSEGGDEDGHS